jgi:hypothetical protein
VPIIKHPDVRRMLLGMKSQVEAMRMLTLRAAYSADVSGEKVMAAARENAEAAFYCGKILSGKLYLSNELKQLCGYLDYITVGEPATVNERTVSVIWGCDRPFPKIYGSLRPHRWIRIKAPEGLVQGLLSLYYCYLSLCLNLTNKILRNNCKIMKISS